MIVVALRFPSPCPLEPNSSLTLSFHFDLERPLRMNHEISSQVSTQHVPIKSAVVRTPHQQHTKEVFVCQPTGNNWTETETPPPHLDVDDANGFELEPIDACKL